jgi:hypothetical protein
MRLHELKWPWVTNFLTSLFYMHTAIRKPPANTDLLALESRAYASLMNNNFKSQGYKI